MQVVIGKTYGKLTAESVEEMQREEYRFGALEIWPDTRVTFRCVCNKTVELWMKEIAQSKQRFLMTHSDCGCGAALRKPEKKSAQSESKEVVAATTAQTNRTFKLRRRMIATTIDAGIAQWVEDRAKVENRPLGRVLDDILAIGISVLS